MNRRDFLKNLLIAGASVATPKLIFDMGANSHLYTRTSFEDLFKLYEELKTKGLVVPFSTDEMGSCSYNFTKFGGKSTGVSVEVTHREFKSPGYFRSAVEAGLAPEYSNTVYSELILRTPSF